MHKLTLSLLSAALVAPAALAQTLVAPPGFAAAEGNSNNIYPWGRGTSSMRTQYIYDSVTFTSQSVTTPVSISRLRFRADGVWATNWTGGTYPQVKIDMSSCPVNHLAASATFAANQGANLTTVLNGPVTITAGTGSNPGPWYIDIPLTTPFVYYPALGEDLTVDIQLDGTGWNGGTTGYAPFDAVASSNAFGTRVFDDTTNTPNGTAGTIETNYAAVCEFTYAPAAGLFPAFSATPTSGISPLAVQFTDLSYSSAPGGVLSWQWDFDGDNIVDSTLQNPSFVYTGCGDFTVSLTVSDALNPLATITRTAFVQTDRLQASFTKTSLGGGLFQFTDTSNPPALAWAWDFNGDNITDSTAQNPTWAFPLTCTANTITLVATRNCRSSTATDTAFAAAASLSGAPTGNNGHSGNPYVGNLFNIDVTTPDGISVCAITQGLWNYVGPFHADIYITPTTYVGKDTVAANWRLVASGNGVAPAAAPVSYTRSDVLLNSPFYLPAGQYGIAIYLSRLTPGLMFTSATGSVQGPFANADLTINPSPVAAPGIVKSTLFGTGRFTPRAWNGTLHYTTVSLTSSGGYGTFGLGCAGSAGVSRLTASSAPALGQTLSVTANNAPSGVAISMVGFSNTLSSSFGPLPFDMASVGAPNCFGRVSPDATTLLLGSGGTITWNITFSTAPWILGIRLYHQMMVLDSATNSLGFVASDAAGMVIGL